MYARQHRTPHIMKPKRGQHHPSNLMFFDTETRDVQAIKDDKSERHELWFGYSWAFRYVNGKVTRSRQERFNTIKDFWSGVWTRLDSSRPLYLFAHNIGFDLTIVNFWHIADELGIKITYMVVEPSLVFISCIWQDCKLVILDTFNYWKCSVEDMGNSLKIPKLPFPGYTASREKWDAYGLRDVEIIANQVMQLLDFMTDEQLGSFGISAASCAMGVFKQKFMKHEIYLHDRERVLALERECYHGGLVTNFYVGKSKGEKLYYTDINSLYPSVMLNEYPVKLLGDFRDLPVGQLMSLIAGKGACARVKIVTHTIPYMVVKDRKLCEVLGSFTTSLCGPELIDAFKLGHIVHIDHLSLYEMQPIFKDYVHYFWLKRLDAKKQGDKVKSDLYKLLLNSLYGKFGQRGNNWVDWSPAAIEYLYAFYGLECPSRFLEKGYEPTVTNFTCESTLEGLPIYLKMKYVGGKLQIKIPTGEHSESFCAIAAYVTSYARTLLRKLITLAGPKQCYYCDTDSLFLTKKGFQTLESNGWIDQTELGKLKLESVSNKWAFYGPKDYEFGGMIKIKGISKRAVRLTDTLFEQLQFEGVKGVFRRGGEAFITIKKVRKQLTRKLTKGRKLASGWVEPFILNE